MRTEYNKLIRDRIPEIITIEWKDVVPLRRYLQLNTPRPWPKSWLKKPRRLVQRIEIVF